MGKQKRESYSKWKEDIFEHLKKYKNKSLKIKEDGEFRGKQYRHILSNGEKGKNYIWNTREVLIGFSEDFIKKLNDEKERIKNHLYWYHLNSSQTLCLNFFLPLLCWEDSILFNELMKEVFGHPIKMTCFQFEHTPNITNFDFYFAGEENDKYYFEIKYTENGIEKRSNAKDIENAYKTYYKEEVENNNLFGKGFDSGIFMKTHYQTYRNVVKAGEKSYSIFITMRGNKSTYNELSKSIKDLNIEGLGENFEDNTSKLKKKNIYILFWEELVKDTIKFLEEKKCKELVLYYKEFEEKYFLKEE